MNTNQAKEIKIVDYLHSLNIHPVKSRGNSLWYISPFREEKTPSFKVDKRLNLWYDHGTAEGGNIIDLTIKLHNLPTVAKALEILSGRKGSIEPFSFSFQQQKASPGIIINQVRELNNPALIQYLTERKIPVSIGREFCREVYFQSNDKNYFAIGFQNDSGGYELRNKYFKGCTCKDITTMQNQNTACYLFEGFMDFLSFKAIYPENKEGDFLILNSLANLSKSIEILKTYPTVFTYLDNDPAGKNAMRELQKKRNPGSRPFNKIHT